MSLPRRLELRRTLLAAGGSLALVAVAGYGNEGCRSPTQVTVELRTVGALPCTSLKGVAIVVASSPEDAEDKMKLESLSAFVARGECSADGRTIGTLVITPSGTAGAILVRARFSDAPDASCMAPDYKGCIVSRRAFTFIDHTPLTLPISLEAACVDVPCTVQSSCRSGVCVSSETACSESSGTCDSPAEPVSDGDGGTGSPDGAPPADASDASDAATEGSSDARTDGPPDIDASSYGNTCPTKPGAGVDCTANAQTCCYMGSYFCAPNCAGDFTFNCLGRKYCGSGFCCGRPYDGANPPGTTCDTTAGQMCSQNGNHFICTTDADCPSSLPKCNGEYYAVTGVTKECTAF